MAEFELCVCEGWTGGGAGEVAGGEGRGGQAMDLINVDPGSGFQNPDPSRV